MWSSHAAGEWSVVVVGLKFRLLVKRVPTSSAAASFETVLPRVLHEKKEKYSFDSKHAMASGRELYMWSNWRQSQCSCKE